MNLVEPGIAMEDQPARSQTQDTEGREPAKTAV